MQTIKEALHWARSQLSENDNFNLEAEILLAYQLHQARTYLHTWPKKELSTEDKAGFETLVARRCQGEPIAYIIGRREFWSLELAVTPATLIPRPETELLVERVLDFYANVAELTVLDLGTGSGAIALALVSERPRWSITAVDISVEALAVAQANAQRLGLGQVNFLCGNWAQALVPRCCDLIVSNPPYIAGGDPHLRQGDVRFEPRGALCAANHGMQAFATIIAQARMLLRPHGRLIMEHGYQQKPVLQTLLEQQGFGDVWHWQDLAGHDRVTSATISP